VVNRPKQERRTRATVTLRTADGRDHVLGHGDLIGRLWSAALQLPSPDISEAHALVSLRGGKLHLLALRGIFAVRGRPAKDLVLAEGQRIALSRELSIDVVGVTLPDWTAGLEGDGLVRQPLAGVSSLLLRPQPSISPGVHPNADAVFFMVDDHWQVRTADQTGPLGEGWEIGPPGARVRAVTISLENAGQRPTTALGQLTPAMRVETHYDTVYIHRDGFAPVTLTGHAARILTELGVAETPLPWASLAAQLWKDDVHRDQLRRRFDAVLARTRRRLRDEGLPPELLSSDGSGNIGMVLRASDRLDDRS
jgi:hypothetical protein